MDLYFQLRMERFHITMICSRNMQRNRLGLAYAGVAGIYRIEFRSECHILGRRSGLMQLMPATARAMGIPAGKESDPEESIKAGVKYIARLQNIFSKVPDKGEQTKFVLAAYNAGVGHITDAMALAEKYGKNRYLWDHHVDHYILLKSNEDYYQDPVCKNGYFRGTETYNFVREVVERAEVYKKKIKG